MLFQYLPPKYPSSHLIIPPPPGMRRVRQALGLHFVGATVQQGSRGPCGGMKGGLSWEPQAVLAVAKPGLLCW